MGTIVVVLLVALVLAAAVIFYAAFPYRGAQSPISPRLGEVMRRGVDSLPTLDQEQQDRSAARRVEAGAGVRSDR